MPTNPLRRVAFDIARERSATVPFAPGELRPSIARTRRIVVAPLPELMRLYREYGPVFTIRVLHAPVTMMIGPEANHYMLVSHAKNFVWREGSMGDLIPLIGDGLLTIDGVAHKTARRLLLPAFHHEQVAASVDTMVEEVDRALNDLGDREARLTSTTGPATWPCGSRCARCSASTLTRAQTGTTPPRSGRPHCPTTAATCSFSRSAGR